LIFELVERQPFEPEVVAYVRVDPPVPLMHRKLDGKIVENIRERVFPKEWFENIFSPEKELSELFRKLRSRFSLKIARHRLWEEARRKCNSAASRIVRVVVHPDYRADGLGILAVRTAVEWIEERRVPERVSENAHLTFFAIIMNVSSFILRTSKISNPLFSSSARYS